MSEVDDATTDGDAAAEPSGGAGQGAKVAIVAAVAVLGVIGGVVLASGSGDSGPEIAVQPSAPAASQPASQESTDTEPAPDYAFTVVSEPDPPVPSGTLFTFSITEAGAPVTGAEVKLSADMTEMSHQGIGDVAVEVAPGQYQVELSFPMRGGYRGDLTVQEAGRKRATLRFSFEVQ